MADMKDMKPYSHKVVSAKSAKHMVAMAESMTTKKHPRSTNGTKLAPEAAKKWGNQG